MQGPLRVQRIRGSGFEETETKGWVLEHTPLLSPPILFGPIRSFPIHPGPARWALPVTIFNF